MIDKARARHERLGRAAGALTLGKPGVVSTGSRRKRPAQALCFDTVYARRPFNASGVERRQAGRPSTRAKRPKMRHFAQTVPMHAAIELTSYQPPFRERLVALWRASFAHGVGAPVPHPLEDHLRFLDDHLLMETTVHLALRDGELVGFGAFTPEAVMQLYVAVAHLGQGIGSRLLDRAKADSHGSLWLYTFVTNTNAQRFYERHGFDVVERGFEPVMQLGDLRYEWRRPGR